MAYGRIFQDVYKRQVLAESRRFENGMILADLDLKRICSERRRMTTFQVENPREQYDYMDFELEMEDLKELKRPVDPSPFIPSGAAERNERCEEILTCLLYTSNLSPLRILRSRSNTPIPLRMHTEDCSAALPWESPPTCWNAWRPL